VPVAEVQSMWGANWYRDDQIVVSTRGRLAIVPAAGGAPRVFLSPDTSAGEGSYRFPFVLADGKTVLFASYGSEWTAGARIGVASLQGGGRRMLDLAGTDPVAVLEGDLIYASASGAIMAVPFDERRRVVAGTSVPVANDVLVGSAGPLKGAVSRSGSLVYLSGKSTKQVVLATPGGDVRTLVSQPGRYRHPRFSPDGTQLALEVNTGSANEIYILDIASGTLTPLTTEGASNMNPAWTPDGKRVLFSSMRDGRPGLWWQAADHSGPAERLVKADSVVVQEGALSPDGSTLVIRVDGMKTTNDLWYRSMTGDTVKKPLATTPFNEYGPRISPDGRWVAFASDVSGRFQVYVIPLPGPGGRHQVSINGGVTPVWSRDGHRLFYVTNDQLLAATLSFAPTFSVTARDTVFVSGMATTPARAEYDAAPDGKHFVHLRNVGGDAQVVVVHDWKYELRARHNARAR